MALGGRKFPARSIQRPSPPSPAPPLLSFLDKWKERVLMPTVLAGITGGVGLVSKHQQVHPNIPTTYATNFVIVGGCCCGAREFVRVTRKSEHDYLTNSAIQGPFSGALLG